MAEPKQRFRLCIRVAVQPAPDDTGMTRGYGNLEINETVEITADGFLDLCKILAQFDELAKTLNKKSVDVSFR